MLLKFEMIVERPYFWTCSSWSSDPACASRKIDLALGEQRTARSRAVSVATSLNRASYRAGTGAIASPAASNDPGALAKGPGFFVSA